ncbi:flavodoxin family protein [Roseovarius sp. D22-M7]|uniref:flavodoxin family protein n=1 Tax=Roseovarius sp. D22-M7 TaxID=3127116 RepID=UPI00301031F5
MSTLVVYFSQGGHTATVATAIAARLGATAAVIEEQADRDGVLGIATGAAAALIGHPSTIKATDHDPAAFDLVILGTPVWVGAPAPAVTAYIDRHRDALDRVAFFCTEARSGGAQALARMERRLGHPPLATLEVAEEALDDDALGQRLDDFLSELDETRTGSPQ